MPAGKALDKESNEMMVCVPVETDGSIAPGWGRAPRVAVADVRSGAISHWREFDVRWDELHDEGTEGGHHARIARFLQEHGIETVVADHMGPPMQQMLSKMGLAVRLGATGDARTAVVAAVTRLVN